MAAFLGLKFAPLYCRTFGLFGINEIFRTIHDFVRVFLCSSYFLEKTFELIKIILVAFRQLTYHLDFLSILEILGVASFLSVVLGSYLAR